VKLDAARAAEEMKRFLELAIREMGLALEYDISASGDSAETEIVIAFRGEDEALLLERNAELLLALEHIAHRWLRLDPRMHDRVRFDCGDYRSTRLEELNVAEEVRSQRAPDTDKTLRFNPMSSRERRVVHLELNGAPGVRTVSDGAGDRRQLVVYPLKQNDASGRPR